ncbi:MAG: hypothetical protein QGH12_04240, partial [SAR324 cluster bacterium]|nr:hypothetical protein [SAR324 cluster bacterium]
MLRLVRKRSVSEGQFLDGVLSDERGGASFCSRAAEGFSSATGSVTAAGSVDAGAVCWVLGIVGVASILRTTES